MKINRFVLALGKKVLYRHITYIGVVLDSSEHAVSDSDDEPSINNNLTTPC